MLSYSICEIGTNQLKCGGVMSKEYSIKGLVCDNCANAIENILKNRREIRNVSVNYDSRTLSIDFIGGRELSISKLNSILETRGYILTDRTNSKKSIFVTVSTVLIVGILVLSRQLGFSITPEISNNMSYFMLLIAGVLTSFHCIAMCGGIAMTQSIEVQEERNSSLYRALKYNFGRVISYTLLGGVIGAIGSVISVGGSFRGIVSIFAGIFMIILSLNLLGIVKVNLPKFIKRRSSLFKSENGPFVVGLVNGFMPCGPLQTMQLYALGTGTIIGGMSAMFFFSLGTVPMMLGLGVFTSVLSKNGGRKFIQASSIVVLLLGIIMVNRGLLLGGYGVAFENNTYTQEYNSESVVDKTESESTYISVSDVESMPYQLVDGVQVVQMTIMSDRYVLSSPLVAGIPARIELNIEGINRCNSPVLIPKAGVEIDLLRDNPVMEFTPEEVGDLKVTCWMGMITTNAKIVESLSN